ncbi:protein XNDC1N isoform X2 [Acinonyx jubatus]|uniref:Protein XNDC1N isoform X2 n=1 Tax=Acinonyx jubatus TaxID=32536 RepID=A0ABM3NJK3_ACIJB|nr:protein XNDC1N isoform X2 [Acinonyx jubatus]
MAPVKISHIVSFSSQDPKYPVENLLNPDCQKGPWLSCPQDKSGQLKVELQLERAVPIGYIDVGNCGCAFLQIDVGRSSWSLDRPFVTLLPATMLMSLADSKQGKNRSGVRMFKDEDFLAAASGEPWDRLRLTCSQPFTRQQSFGLAFLRVCSSLDSSDDPVGDLSAPGSTRLSQGSDAQESGPSPWLANPSIRRTFFPDPQTSTKEISELRNILKQLQPGALGRSACMVLSAARRVPPVSMASTKNIQAEPGPSHPASTELRPEEQNSENNVGRMKRRKVQAHRLLQHQGSSLACCDLWRDLPTSPSLSLLITIFIAVCTVGVLPGQLTTHFLGPVPFMPVGLLSRRSRRTCQHVWGVPSGMSHEVLWFWPPFPQ